MSRSEPVAVVPVAVVTTLLEQRARVVAISDGQLQLAPVRPADCPRCAAGQGCGGQLFGASTIEQRAAGVVAGSPAGPLIVPINPHVSVSVGDVIVVGIQPHTLQKAALLLYAVPLLVMLVAALLLNQLAFSEPVQALLIALSLVASFLLIRRYSRPLARTPLLTVLRKDASAPCPIANDGY